MPMSENRSARRRRQLRRGVFLLPSLLTTGNLFAGYYSMVASLHGEYGAAAIAIGVAFVIDGLDGRIARLTNSQSDFGEVYDSLADVIAFGAAPAALALSWGLWDLGRVGWLASFFFLVCVSLRLGRFGTKSGGDPRFFVGLPCPAAAGVVAAAAFYWPVRIESLPTAQALLACLLAVSLLMVSRLRYRSFKDFDLRRPQTHMVIVLLASIIALIVLDPENVLLLMAATYALSGPADKALARAARWRASRTSHGSASHSSERGT